MTDDIDKFKTKVETQTKSEDTEFIKAINKGLKSIRDGRTFTHEEVLAKLNLDKQ